MTGLLFTVNPWGLLLGVVASMVIGMVWYSPLLFGRKWMELVGMTPEMADTAKKGGQTSYIFIAISALILAYVLGFLFNNMFVPFITHAITIGALVWVGFVATSMSADYLFSPTRKPWSLYVLNAGYQLVIILANSIILYFFSL